MGPQFICSLDEVCWPRLSRSDSGHWSVGLAFRVRVGVKFVPCFLFGLDLVKACSYPGQGLAIQEHQHKQAMSLKVWAQTWLTLLCHIPLTQVTHMAKLDMVGQVNHFGRWFWKVTWPKTWIYNSHAEAHEELQIIILSSSFGFSLCLWA